VDDEDDLLGHGRAFAAERVGAEYPAGAHSHLADQGHEIVVSRGPRKGHKLGIRSAKKEFMAPAIDSTRTQARQKTIDKLVDAIKKAGG
jgi:hypothetical protein